MKFSEYLTLKEDGEGGGDASGGDVSVPVTADVVDTAQPDLVPDNVAGKEEIENHIQPGNTTANMAGYPGILGYYSRINMPQITKSLYNEFINDLKLNNISYKRLNVKAGELNPTQGEFNQDKINNIKASIKDKTYIHSPLLVAGGENHIVDGHHRWAAFDKDDYIPIDHVDLSFEDLYDFLQNKPYVLQRDIKQ